MNAGLEKRITLISVPDRSVGVAPVLPKPIQIQLEAVEAAGMGGAATIARNVPPLSVAGPVPAAGIETISAPKQQATNDLYKRYVNGSSEPISPEHAAEKPGLLSRISSGIGDIAHALAHPIDSTRALYAKSAEKIGSITEGVKDSANSTWDGLKAFFTHPIDSINSAFSRLGEKLSSAFNSVTSWLSDAVSKAGSWSSAAANPSSDGSGFFGTEAKVMNYVIEVAKQAAVEAEQKRKVLEETSQVAKKYVSGTLEYGNDPGVASKMNDIYATPAEVAAAVAAAKEKHEAEQLRANIARHEAQNRSPGASPDSERRIQEQLGANGTKAHHQELSAVEKETIKKISSGTTDYEVADGTRRAQQLLTSKLGASSSVAARLGDALYRNRDDEGVRELLDRPDTITKDQMAVVMRRLGVELRSSADIS